MNLTKSKNKGLQKIDRMNSFLKWYKETIQSVHEITDETFVNILNCEY